MDQHNKHVYQYLWINIASMFTSICGLPVLVDWHDKHVYQYLWIDISIFTSSCAEGFLCVCVQRIMATVNNLEQKRLLMDLDINMRSGSCPYTVEFYGALFREVSAELKKCVVYRSKQGNFIHNKQRKCVPWWNSSFAKCQSDFILILRLHYERC